MSAFEARHLFRLRDMIASFDAGIQKDEAEGRLPHRKYANRSALKGLLAGAEQLHDLLRASQNLLKVIDAKVPVSRVRTGDGPIACTGCGAKGMSDCTADCWVDLLEKAADELDEVIP